MGFICDRCYSDQHFNTDIYICATCGEEYCDECLPTDILYCSECYHVTCKECVITDKKDEMFEACTWCGEGLEKKRKVTGTNA